jgi:D-alanyl-D-alanine carboxypeptidase/D-alanyl-D-alanine-endopeptidase (penicillin-binding protein 4)
VILAPRWNEAWWGVEVRSLQTGKLLYQRNAGKNLKPASTFKLLATAAALDAMPPDTRLRTTVESAAALDASGRLVGDVYLVGRGDPGLSGRFVDGRWVDFSQRPAERRPTAELERLADQLKAAGVQRIEGRLIGHEGAFTGDRRGSDWAWEDLVWCYGAEVSALSFNDNCAELRALPGAKPGDPLQLERTPVSAYYQVVSTATTAPAGAKSELRLERPLGLERDPPLRQLRPSATSRGKDRSRSKTRLATRRPCSRRCWRRAASCSRAASPPRASRCPRVSGCWRAWTRRRSRRS